MGSIELTKKLSVKREYDVIVCGGGVAGVAAAVTAAKEGFSTLLLEKSFVLGGLSTLGLVNLFVPMCNGYGFQFTLKRKEGLARTISSQHQHLGLAGKNLSVHGQIDLCKLI